MFRCSAPRRLKPRAALRAAPNSISKAATVFTRSEGAGSAFLGWWSQKAQLMSCAAPWPRRVKVGVTTYKVGQFSGEINRFVQAPAISIARGRVGPESDALPSQASIPPIFAR